MPRVIRDLPNGSDLISGVKFFPLEDGRLISDEIDEEMAEMFCSVPGYTLDEEDAAPPAPKVEPAAPPAPKLTKAQQKAAEKAAKEAANKAAGGESDKGDGTDETDANGADQTGSDAGDGKPAGETENPVF